jgi:hypothetical protein
METSVRRLLDEFVDQVTRLAPPPAPTNISKVVIRFAERLPVSPEDLNEYLGQKGLPPMR